MICAIPSCTNTAHKDGLCRVHYHERAVEETCECPPGAWHERECPLAYWPESAA